MFISKFIVKMLKHVIHETNEFLKISHLVKVANIHSGYFETSILFKRHLEFGS
jgi:hypothetical protein